MKRGKIILSAVALFAIIGGALAFKTTRTQQWLYYAPTSTTFCTYSTFTFLTTSAAGSAITYYSTAPTATTPKLGVCSTFTTPFS